MNIADFFSSFGKDNNKHSAVFISRIFKRGYAFLVPDNFWYRIKDKAKNIRTENVLINILLAIISCFFSPALIDLIFNQPLSFLRNIVDVVIAIISFSLIIGILIWLKCKNKSDASSKEEIISLMTIIEEMQELPFLQTTDFSVKNTASSTHTASSTKKRAQNNVNNLESQQLDLEF